MAANTFPIVGRTPDVQGSGAINSGLILGPTANTARDGTGTLYCIFQADATEGGFVDSVVFMPVVSPAATLIHLYYCSATGAFTPGTTNTASNTTYIDNRDAPAITVSQTLGQNPIVFALRRPLMAGTRLLVGFGTSTGAAGTGWVSTTYGSKY